MAHSHSGCQSPRDYFTEQLLTILVCGALAFVGIQLYLGDRLRHILAPQFHLPVLIGSLAVLALVAVRAVSVWREAGELQPLNDMNCDVNHVHSAACNHLPGLPGDPNDPALADDGHSHDMSWMFARMLILVFPVALFALGVPNSSFSKEAQLRSAGSDTALNLDPKVIEAMAKDPTTEFTKPTETQPDGTQVRELKTAKGLKIREISTTDGTTKYVVIPGDGAEMRFNDLTEAALDADKRKALEGQTAIMQGRFRRLGDKEFTLFRMKMTCCGPDAVTLKVRIVAPQAVNTFADFDWVQVKGVIQFLKVPGQQRYTPVLVLPDVTDVDRVPMKNGIEYEF